MICRMDFDMFFGPTGGLCKGSSPCMMADFQNGLISRIFSDFWSDFLNKTTLNDL